MNKREFFQKYERIPIALTEVKRRKMYGMIDQEHEIYYPDVIATNDGDVLYGNDPIRVWCKDVTEDGGFVELFPNASSAILSSDGYTLHETKPARSKSKSPTRSKAQTVSKSKSKMGGSRKKRKGGRR